MVAVVMVSFHSKVKKKKCVNIETWIMRSVSVTVKSSLMVRGFQFLPRLPPMRAQVIFSIIMKQLTE